MSDSEVGNEFLPQVMEFKYLGILFSSDCTREWAGESEQRERFCQKAKLSIYRSIFVSTLTYGHEGWVMTERTRSRIQAAEMGLLRRVTGLSLRDRVRSSVIREELGVETLLLCVERSQLRWFGHMVRMPPGRIPRCSRHVQLGGGHGVDQVPGGGTISPHWPGNDLGIPQSELADVAGKREVWETGTATSTTLPRISG